VVAAASRKRQTEKRDAATGKNAERTKLDQAAPPSPANAQELSKLAQVCRCRRSELRGQLLSAWPARVVERNRSRRNCELRRRAPLQLPSHHCCLPCPPPTLKHQQSELQQELGGGQDAGSLANPSANLDSLIAQVLRVCPRAQRLWSCRCTLTPKKRLPEHTHRSLL
jgi:hypothetical protein